MAEKKIGIYLLAALFFSVSIVGCKQMNIYEKNTIIPKRAWTNELKAEGTFQLTDTLSSYNIYIVIRHTDAYRYNNIWLNVGLQSPGDTMFYQRLDLGLGTDANGWEGVGMNDIWEVRKLLNSHPSRFKKAGEYKFSIGHLMRDNPLLNVMSVGLRVEKAE